MLRRCQGWIFFSSKTYFRVHGYHHICDFDSQRELRSWTMLDVSMKSRRTWQSPLEEYKQVKDCVSMTAAEKQALRMRIDGKCSETYKRRPDAGPLIIPQHWVIIATSFLRSIKQQFLILTATNAILPSLVMIFRSADVSSRRRLRQSRLPGDVPDCPEWICDAVHDPLNRQRNHPSSASTRTRAMRFHPRRERREAAREV